VNLERKVILFFVDAHCAALSQLTKEEFVSQCPIDAVTDKPRHRPCAHQRIVTIFRKPLPGALINLQDNVLVGQLSL
jgi:hypothetical protein